MRFKKSFFSIEVRQTPWLIGAQISELRNELFATESIFRETYLVTQKLVKSWLTTKTFENVCIPVKLAQQISFIVI